MTRKAKNQPPGCGMVAPIGELGAYLRKRRLDIGLTQVEMSHLLGWTKGRYGQLERGDNIFLYHSTVERLADGWSDDVKKLLELVPTRERMERTTELGKFILNRRRELGWSVAELQRRLAGCYASGYEKRTSLRFRSRKTLARALKIKPSALDRFVESREKETTCVLGNIIRKRRKKLGLSGQQLAEMIPITRQCLSQIELGKHGASDQTLNAIAKALHMRPSKLRVSAQNRSF